MIIRFIFHGIGKVVCQFVESKPQPNSFEDQVEKIVEQLEYFDNPYRRHAEMDQTLKSSPDRDWRFGFKPIMLWLHKKIGQGLPEAVNEAQQKLKIKEYTQAAQRHLKRKEVQSCLTRVLPDHLGSAKAIAHKIGPHIAPLVSQGNPGPAEARLVATMAIELAKSH